MIDNDRRAQIVANALRKAFRTNAFNPWDGIARQAVRALDEQYLDRDLDSIKERDELEAYIKGHELMMRYKQEIWNEGFKAGWDAAKNDRPQGVHWREAHMCPDNNCCHGAPE